MARRLLFPACLALVAALACWPANVAWAHAIVLESRPAAAESVAGPDVEFFLRFNSRIDVRRSRLDLMQPDGTTRELAIEPDEKPDRFTARAAGLVAGDYPLLWQVLSIDGHITRGTIPFRVRAS